MLGDRTTGWDPLDLLRVLYVTGAAVVAIRWALPRLFDLTFIAGMVLAGWGEALGFYERFVFYDEVVHAAMPLLITPVVYILVSRLEVLRPLHERGSPHNVAGILVVAVMLGTAVATARELVEWTADGLLGWSLIPSLMDTMTDLALGALGALGGGVLLAVWSGRGWGTTRRRPDYERKSDAQPPA